VEGRFLVDVTASSRFFMDISPEGDPGALERDPEGTSPRFFKDVDSSGWLDDAITAPQRRELEQNQLWASRVCGAAV